MTPNADDIRARLLATFRTEAEEHLAAISHHLALLASSAASESAPVIESLFREVHTLKGAARSVAVRDVEAVCQAAESLLHAARQRQRTVSDRARAALVDAHEAVAALLAGVRDAGVARSAIAGLEAETARVEQRAASSGEDDDEQTGRQAAAAAAPRSQPAPGTRSSPVPGARPADTLRVEVGEFDLVVAEMENLLAVKLAAGERAREGRELRDALAACRPLVATPAAGAGAGPEAELAFRRATSLAAALAKRLAEDQRAVSKTVESLDGRLRGLRMTPAAAVVEAFGQMVADLAAERGKVTDWAVEGGELEVDRLVLHAIKEPLIHLVRNAVDHGIETPAERVQAGKPPNGRVLVRFGSVEGGRVRIDVVDDGRGVDVEALRNGAVRSGVVAAEDAAQISDEAALDLAYRSGVTTSAMVTRVSGRGLGLAIVREQVDRLGGRIWLDTQRGRGTTVSLNLPASIAAFTGLLVRAGGRPFLLPIEAVVRALPVPTGAVRTFEGKEVISFDGQPVLFARLAGILGLAEAADSAVPGPSPRTCVVVEHGGVRAALELEALVGTREVVVEQLEPPLVHLKFVSAAGLLGSGEIVPILRTSDLVRAAGRALQTPAETVDADQRTHRPVVLVVDDSITTRTMEKSLLEAVGYQVRVAADGLEAWSILKTEAVDLVISDVDMPRLDGFDLTARIRSDPHLADLPVVLVTVLEAREDKERGIAVGANAYMVKSSFDQSNLLEIIHRLV